MDSVISSSFPAYKNVTVYQSFAFNATKTSTSSNDNQHEFTNRSARDARLLKGETMGGLEGCASFEVGDVAKREFYSPNYPEDYPRDIICTKKIIGKCYRVALFVRMSLTLQLASATKSILSTDCNDERSGFVARITMNAFIATWKSDEIGPTFTLTLYRIVQKCFSETITHDVKFVEQFFPDAMRIFFL